MLFNSLSFLLFFPVTVIFYFVLPKKIKNIWLLITSYFFYMGWNPKYALLLLFSTSITFFSALIIEKIKNNNQQIKKMSFILITSISLILLVLFYFKYLNFSINIINDLCSKFGINVKVNNFDIILPVEISFFSFQSIGYLVDVYRGEIYAEKNFFKYALFVSFFPQLVAGPIERSKNLLKQYR